MGSVVVFLPQILLLFLFIGILEDSGYLARAALIADRTMARFGLQGKSFIPLLSAYACAVPAIMATRTIENKRDRIATILIAPFMTCSARLPVYIAGDRGVHSGPAAGGLLPGHSRGCDAGVVYSWVCRCHCNGAAAQVHGAQEQALLVHSGDAALPLAHLAFAGTAADGPFQGVPAARRHGDLWAWRS